MKKGLIIGFTVLIVLLATGAFASNTQKPVEVKQSPTVGQVVSEQNPSAGSEKVEGVTAEVAVGRPVRLLIPTIGVDAYVESVGLDDKGNMDIPKKDENVAWYNLGYELGENGNTVLAGHYDTRTGAPAVFYDLADLQEGEKITAIDENGHEHGFTVTSTVKYPYNAFPVQEVFGPFPENRLVLITCDGNYNTNTRNYSHRTVVYAKAD